ncbi:25816_t:CDS:2 [Gigaspora rosea]|nr:25816_t:CDS:2 [Gigaspora rosea]
MHGAEPITNPSKLYCEWCEKAKFNNIFTKAQEIELHTQLTIHESVKKPLLIEKLRIIQNMCNMYWLVENNIATFNIQDLCSLVKMQIPNREEYIIFTSACTIKSVFLNTTVLEERCKYGSYSNNHAEHDFIEAIAQVIEESTIKELSKSLTWSIMIDERTTITNHKNLVIVSKHLVNNIPCYRYLGMIQLTSVTANSITSELLHFFTAKNIPTKALYHVGSDGARKINSIAAQLKEIYPFLTIHHCILHCLALARKDAAKKVTYFSYYESIVKKLYTYFSTSYSRMQNLKMIEKDSTNYISLFDIKLQLNATINAITTEFIGKKHIEPTWENHLKNYLKEKNIDESEVPLFVQDFAKAVIESLKERFPDHDLIDLFRILDPKKLPTDKSILGSYSQDSIQKLIEFYGVSKFVKGNI